MIITKLKTNWLIVGFDGYKDPLCEEALRTLMERLANKKGNK